MIDIRLTTSILSLDRTPAEKILLAYICQQAATSEGTCTASNKELAQATGLHRRTIPDLVKRLSQAHCLQASVDQSQANRRTLRPVEDFLEDYTPLSSSLSADYTRLNSSPPSDYTHLASRAEKDYTHMASSSALVTQQPTDKPQRLCPMTGVDITHQRADVRLASRLTFKQFRRDDPQTFQKLRAQFVDPTDPSEPCARIADRIRELFKANATPAAANRQPAPKQALSGEGTAHPSRVCPITGVTITHQDPRHRFLNDSTLRELYRSDRSRYDKLVAQLLRPDQAQSSRDGQFMLILRQIRQLAKARGLDKAGPIRLYSLS